MITKKFKNERQVFYTTLCRFVSLCAFTLFTLVWFTHWPHHKNQKKHDYLYWEFHELGGRQAIRKDNWKLVKYNVKKTPNFFLFDIDKDPFEKNNLSDKFPEKIIELTKILENASTKSENFNF